MHGDRSTNAGFPDIKGKPKLKPDSIRDFDLLPDSALIRPSSIVALCGCSPAKVWRFFQNGKLTRRKLGPRTTAATVGEVRALLRGEGGA